MQATPDTETGRTEHAHVRTVKEQLTSLTHLDLNVPWLPLAESWSPQRKEETPASHFSFSFESRVRGTPTVADVLGAEPGGQSFAVPATEEEQRSEPVRDRAGREANTRLELLARKAAAALTAEEDARLRVATERLRKLLPRVTSADFEALADAAEKVKAIGDETAAIRSELGL
ncbi:MAG: hypothetical protein HYZ28_01145 [Myxococcales bacterium]|nr:hypothetical protein [Myxococcales bacterium]